MSEKTCSERIRGMLKSRESDLQELIEKEGEALENGDYEYAGLIYEFPAGISQYTVLKIELSGGGPADWLEAYVDTQGTEAVMYRVEYHFSDWFDHAEMVVSEDSPLYSLAEEFVYLTFNI